ncbi:uncharacterized protein LOC129244294 [Anastrepha obliqua]|uniref:uncharacterized protein LOC129244294 n=1 Tax=Anastrepha obliqua TaxID=95512 RepID=UPI002409EC77|nr:uncharacterized protein LOC129244294 [Anastrepha obliqua]
MERKYKQLMSNKLAIVNFSTNTKKTAKNKQTKGFLQARKLLLEQYWTKFIEIYQQIICEWTQEQQAAAEITIAEDYEIVERTYAETMGELNDILETSEPHHESLTETSFQVQHVGQALPRIKVPSFDGNFLQWIPFKDLFNSLVISNTALTNTQRLQYLKDSLTGEAKNALDNITTTDANFKIAWDLLKSKYENKRVIINAHLTAITKLPSAQKESASALRSLLDGVTSSIRALQHLGRPVEQWDDWLIFTIIHKLDPITRKAWELSLKSNDSVPTFKELEEFLASRTQSLEIVQSFTEDKPHPSSKRVNNLHGVSGYHTTSSRCSSCSGKHFIMFCGDFLKLSPNERYQCILKRKLCINCLRSGHQQSGCTSARRCYTCNAKHHTMLHEYFASTTANSSTNPVSSHHVSQSNHKFSIPQVILGTALVEVRSQCGHVIVLRALLDSGAEATFISEYAVNSLCLPKSNVKVSINGANGSRVATAKGLVTFTLHSLKSDFNMPCTALVLPRVGNITPTLNISNNELRHFKDLDLADPKLTIPKSIDIILNAENYAAVLLSGIRRSSHNNLVAQNTQLGWVVFGGCQDHALVTPKNSVECHNTQIDLDRTLRRFWELEELNSATSLTEEERFVEEHFQNTTCRRKDGRYIVRLPIKRDVDLKQLITSQCDAVALHGNLQRRLSRDASMRTMYTDFMYEYLSLKHMQLITGNINCLSPVCYLPHHGVLKASSTTTKLRVVFNASKKCSSGKSLNDCLYPGPKLQNDLTAVVMNWRRYQVALTGDITKMYRQILVDERDADLQRIVWSPTKHEHPSHYRLNTVTYGTSCAPYLAIKVLHTLASDEKCNFPEATQILRHEFYVDDVLTGADNVADACRRRSELQTLLQAGGFTLCKWNSNSTEILQTINPTHLEFKTSHEFQMDEQSNTLGLVWTPKSDCLTFTLKLDYTITTFTKRQLLSDIAKLFDPLGFLAPIIIRGKIFMQKLWLTGLDWNDTLPDDLNAEWVTFRNELKLVPLIQIARWINISNTAYSYELHAFADASIHAYAAVVYLKVVSHTSVNIHLIISKTRVAPLKKVTIPRLELCAAVLAAQLCDKVRATLNLHPIYLLLVRFHHNHMVDTI